MAARLKAYHQDEIRAKIQASQLVNRLTGHALGEIELTPTQIKAIEILLRKSLADLSAITISGDGDNPLEVNLNKIERVVIGAKNAQD